MPNWCECELRIYGDEKIIKEFKEFGQNGDEVLDTNKFIPYPERFRVKDELAFKWEEDNTDGDRGERPTDGFNSGGYDWCLKHWGTKWGICHSSILDKDFFCDDSMLAYSFDCAWSPCIPVVLRMSAMFPDLTFRLTYFECGAGFNGLYECKNGKVLTDEVGNYFGERGG